MKLRVFCFLLAIGGAKVAVAGMLPVAATGANVDESRVQTIYHVDPADAEAADDDKHGTAETPFATLGYACQLAARQKDAGVGVKLVLASGTYRETAEIPGPPGGKPDTDAPLVIEAADRDQAIIDGADTQGWTPSTWKIENGRWTHPWPIMRNRPPAAPGPYSGAAYRRGDLIVVNGMPLRQVNTETDLVPGTFWGRVAHTASNADHTAFAATAVVQPPEGVDLNEAIVQVGARAFGLKITARHNVVVRGVMCQHMANPAGVGYGQVDMAGLDLWYCSNVLLEDVLSQWNDGVGVQLDRCSDVTLRRVHTLHNASSGLLTLHPKNLLAEDCDASFNHFRADWAGVVDLPETPGFGAVCEVGAEIGTWRRLRAVGNFGRGLCLNTGTNLTVEDGVITDNVLDGIWVEGCAGPVSVRRCEVAGMKPHATQGKELGPAGGVVLRGSGDVSLESNILSGNAVTQLSVGEIPGAKLPARSERHAYRHNVLLGLDAAQNLWQVPEGAKSGALEAAYFRTLTTDENCYWNPAATAVFAGADRSGMTLEKWQEFLLAHAGKPPAPPGTDVHSLWQDPLFADPAEGDFRLREKSPVTDWGLPSDDATAAP